MRSGGAQCRCVNNDDICHGVYPGEVWERVYYDNVCMYSTTG